MQQAIILTTVVNNGEYSTESSLNPYVCENTNDKIFLLSYKEAQNLKYFSSSSKRERVTSDYTRAMGISITTMEEFYGRAFWKLRSPSKDFNSSVNYVHFYGYVYYYSGVDNDNVGVVPALKIRL